MNNIYFRADGNSEIGLGHIIRSLALVEMLNEEFSCHFIIQNPSEWINRRILEVCKTIICIPKTINELPQAKWMVQNHLTKKDIVVLDGYSFTTEYQQIIKNKASKLVCIDDIHDFHFVADIIINQAGGISSNNYSTESYTKLYLGTKYALLRKPFREASKNKRYPKNRDQNIFICLGGADPNNDILGVLKKVEALKNKFKVYLVIGEAYNHLISLNQFLKKTSLKIELLTNLSAKEMVVYMKKCGQAITPPSTTSFEYSSVGGILYLKVIAKNQHNINKYFISENLGFNFDHTFPIAENSEKKSLLKKQDEIFDGLSDLRLLKLFKNLRV